MQCFNIGVGAPERDWGIDNLARLLSLLLDKTSYNIIITDNSSTRGSDVLSRLQAISGGKAGKMTEGRIIDLSGQTSVGELAALTSMADIVFGMESLGTHLAAAFGKRIVSVHSSVTYAKEWGPYTKDAKVFQALPASHHYNREKAVDMMQSIRPEMVLSAFLYKS